MTDQDRPLYKVQLAGGMGKSIFPPFDVQAPMPKGTAVPPQVAIKPASAQGGSATGTDSAGSSQSQARPANQ